MTGTDSYSITPASNATADGGAINWAEGQPPSSVNNTARQWMADERASFNDLQWFQYGTGDQGAGNIAVPSVYASGTTFAITGANVTTVYHAYRRVRAVGSSTGTIYGTISGSSYNSGNTTTTVTVVWDSGSLSNETLVISLSQSPKTGNPVAGVPVLLSVLTASNSATLSYTTMTAAYSSYVFKFVNILPVSVAALYAQVSVDNGANYLGTSIYTYGAQYIISAASPTPAAAGAEADTVLVLNATGTALYNTSNFGFNSELTFYQPSSSTYKKLSWDMNYFRTPGDHYVFGTAGGTITTGSVINAIKFYMSSGNITTGSIYVYGVP